VTHTLNRTCPITLVAALVMTASVAHAEPRILGVCQDLLGDQTSCAVRTAWSVDKTTSTPEFVAPDGGLAKFTITVTEGETSYSLGIGAVVTLTGLIPEGTQVRGLVVSVQKGEVKFALHQEDGTWAGAITSGARMDSGMWRDVKLVHDTAAARLEIWIDDTLNAATDGVGAMKGSSRDVTLGGAFSRTAFDAALEQLEIRTDPDAYTFDMPEMEQLPGGTMPAPEDESRLDRPDLDTLRAEIEAGTSDLTLREAAPDSPDIWADRGGSLLVGDDGWDRLRDRGGDDVMHGGAGPDQFVFDMRHTDHAQTNRILDLDFNDGDVVRFMTGNSAERIWMKSVDDIQAAVDSGVLTATLDADDSALQLSLARLPQHVVEIDLHAGFAWPDMA